MVNIIISGVGGTGVILVSKIIMEVANNAKFDTKGSEVHGMAQRGGSVECHVRFGEKIYSPLIEKGTADFLLGFEQLETIRKLDYLSPNGRLIMSCDKIDPVPVQTGAVKYPDDIKQWISSHVKKHVFVDANKACKKLGFKKALNVVMLGVLTRYLEFSDDVWEPAVKSLVKEKFVEMNLKAIELGKSL